MTKAEFLGRLRDSLNGLSPADINTSMEFYSEIIDDRMEEGLSEEDAVACLGSIEDIKDKVLEAVPISKLVKEKMRPKGPLGPIAIILLILGFPLWFPLLVTAGILVFTMYIVFWIIILSLDIVNLAVLISGGALIFAAFVQAATFAGGLFLVGCGLALIGAAILLFFAFKGLSSLLLKAGKAFLLGLKRLFV